jgi:hypothetical protein
MKSEVMGRIAGLMMTAFARLVLVVCYSKVFVVLEVVTDVQMYLPSAISAWRATVTHAMMCAQGEATEAVDTVPA